MKISRVFFTATVFIVSLNAFAAQTPIVADPPGRGDFSLVEGGKAATICVDPADHSVVNIVADDLALDIERVTGIRPEVAHTGLLAEECKVVIGSLDKSGIIEPAARAADVDLAPIRGQWESFIVAASSDLLVIAGSDRRAAAFGSYELSRGIGVSPWVWWADSKPVHQNELHIKSGAYRQGPPSVKYRGIFINDECLAMQPWSAKTLDPETNDIGPTSYARVFELLLRLKANHLWPAMHRCTRAFNYYPQNKVVADNYAIVMGSSHSEPLLRNNVDEWERDGKGRWWYQFNRENIMAYWEQRVQENGKYENVYTLGMRALHDWPIHAIGGEKTRMELVEKVFSDQRSLLSKHVNPDPTQVPQVFIPYNEVLGYVDQGLEVPDDVTMVWVDDNHGYIRRLSLPTEQRRSGGSGVYYHVSYMGTPHDYLWLCSTPPALIWEEMYKAYQHGADRLWILNVGDIKPAEMDTEFFFEMGWDINKYGPDAQPKFLTHVATREFGASRAEEVVDILNKYYLLNQARKPEHTSFNTVIEDIFYISDPTLSLFHYGDESQGRIDAYIKLEKQATALYETIPDRMKDAYYQLVLYPVRASAAQNLKILYAHKSRVYEKQDRASANLYARLASDAYQAIVRETDYYNNDLAGGKWRHMMNFHPQNFKVFGMPPTGEIKHLGEPSLGVAIEGAKKPVSRSGRLPSFNRLLPDRTRFIDLFNKGEGEIAWTATADDWIKLSADQGKILSTERVLVSVDPDHAPTKDSTGTITISGAGKSFEIEVPFVGAVSAQPGMFIEENGVIAIDAEDFSVKSKGDGEWTLIPGLGRTGAAMAVMPFDIEPASTDLAPVLEYEIFVSSPGSARLIVEAVPTYAIHEGHALLVAVKIDDGAQEQIHLNRGGYDIFGFHFSEAVLSAVMYGEAEIELAPGRHTVKVFGVDPAVVVDRLVIDLGGLEESYLGPPQTLVK